MTAGIVADSNNSSNLFNASIWPGNNSSQTISIGKQPDLLWFCNRTTGGIGSNNSYLVDSSRGTGVASTSYATAAETDISAFNLSFVATGYSFNTTNATINATGNNYVGWSWRKTPTYLDIVPYTGTRVNRTVSHSLAAVPKGIIIEDCTSGKWSIYHVSMGNTQYIEWNNHDAATTSSTYWQNTTPTSSVFSLGTAAAVNALGHSYVAYVFGAVSGSSAFGSFTGNGSATGPIITTNFTPRFVIRKGIDVGADGWYLNDATRGFNKSLLADSSDAETTDSPAPIAALSTGFQIKTTDNSQNLNGSTYLYMAWA